MSTLKLHGTFELSTQMLLSNNICNFIRSIGNPWEGFFFFFLNLLPFVFNKEIEFLPICRDSPYFDRGRNVQYGTEMGFSWMETCHFINPFMSHTLPLVPLRSCGVASKIRQLPVSVGAERIGRITSPEVPRGRIVFGWSYL